jgi:hypothetical protein
LETFASTPLAKAVAGYYIHFDAPIGRRTY